MYAVKGLTAWDSTHTGGFKTYNDAEFWVLQELTRKGIRKSEAEFKNFAKNVIYEVV